MTLWFFSFIPAHTLSLSNFPAENFPSFIHTSCTIKTVFSTRLWIENFLTFTQTCAGVDKRNAEKQTETKKRCVIKHALIPCLENIQPLFGECSVQSLWLMAKPQVGAIPFLFVSPTPAFPFQAVSPAAFHSSPLGGEPHSCTYGGEAFSQETGRLSRFFQDCNDLGVQLKIFFHSLYSLHILCSIQHHFIW